MKASTNKKSLDRTLASPKAATIEKLGRWIPQVGRGLGISICLSLLAASEALASFSFTKIADTHSGFTSVSSGAAINDSGTVAFFATPSAGTQGIYTSSRGAITKIVNKDHLSSLFNNNMVVFGQTLNINNNGTVAFLASEGRGSAGAATRLLTSQGGSITTRAIATLSARGNGDSFPGFDLNNQEELAYLTQSQGGPSITNFSYTLAISKPNQPNVTVATAFFQALSPFSAGSLSTIRDFAINNRSQVTFNAQRGQPGSFSGAIYRGDGGPLTTLIDTDTSELDVNDSGDVVLSNNNAIRLFNNTSHTLTTIADSSGAFKTFSSPAINNIGKVAFGADLAVSGKGIFVGPDPVVNKVIVTGDSLNGSTVTNLSFSKKGLNNLGQIAFYAELADGTRGIFQAEESAHIGS